MIKKVNRKKGGDSKSSKQHKDEGGAGMISREMSLMLGRAAGPQAEWRRVPGAGSALFTKRKYHSQKYLYE
jgi:hypothetical protein